MTTTSSMTSWHCRLLHMQHLSHEQAYAHAGNKSLSIAMKCSVCIDAHAALLSVHPFEKKSMLLTGWYASMKRQHSRNPLNTKASMSACASKFRKASVQTGTRVSLPHVRNLSDPGHERYLLSHVAHVSATQIHAVHVCDRQRQL